MQKIIYSFQKIHVFPYILSCFILDFLIHVFSIFFMKPACFFCFLYENLSFHSPNTFIFFSAHTLYFSYAPLSPSSLFSLRLFNAHNPFQNFLCLFFITNPPNISVVLLHFLSSTSPPPHVYMIFKNQKASLFLAHLSFSYPYPTKILFYIVKVLFSYIPPQYRCISFFRKKRLPFREALCSKRISL